MVEGIFTEQTLDASLIEGNQTRDHRLRSGGLRVGNGLLEGNAAGTGIKRDVRQPKPFEGGLTEMRQHGQRTREQIRGLLLLPVNSETDICRFWRSAEDYSSLVAQGHEGAT